MINTGFPASASHSNPICPSIPINPKKWAVCGWNQWAVCLGTGEQFKSESVGSLRRNGWQVGVEYAAWVVDCKSVGTGEKALVYLGRYLYRASSPRKTSSPAPTAKSASVIATPVPESWSAERFPARSSSGWCCSMCCPRDSRRARNFGFLHPNCKRLIALLHLLRKFAPGQAMAWVKQRAPILCDCCGAVMVIVRTRIRPGFAGPPPVPIVTRGAQ